jgi:hypothetical protein
MKMITNRICPPNEALELSASHRERLCAQFCILFADSDTCPLGVLNERREQMRPGVSLVDDAQRVIDAHFGKEVVNA